MEKPFRRSARYYDDFYLRLLDYEKQCDALEKILDKHGVKKGSSLLDLACGTATSSSPLRQKFSTTGAHPITAW